MRGREWPPAASCGSWDRGRVRLRYTSCPRHAKGRGRGCTVQYCAVLYCTMLYSAVLYCTEDWVQVSWPLPTDAKLSPQGGDTALGGGQETLPAPLAAVSSLRFLLTTPDSHHYLSLSPHYSLHQETRAKIKDFRIFR